MTSRCSRRLLSLSFLLTCAADDVIAFAFAGPDPYPSKALNPKTAVFDVKVVTRVNLTAAATVTYTAAGSWATGSAAAANGASASKTVKLPAGVSTITDVLTAADVRLWWPNGYGDQPLYTVNVTAAAQPPTMMAASGKTAAPSAVSVSRRVGFRSVSMDTSSINEELQHHVYVVNGVRIFARGANWVPPDSFEARATDTVLCDILSNAVKANMNFLRIWGGGIYVQDGFMDCADELGLLLEQDGIFSNGVYSAEMPFLSLVGEEIKYQARRLASHPSLFMWSGSNELSPHMTNWSAIFLDHVFPAIGAVDDSRPVWPACPAFPWKSGADVGGLPDGKPFVPSSLNAPGAPNEVHFYKFKMCDTMESCGNCVDDAFYEMTNFASEFGWIGMPSLEALSPVLGKPEEDYTFLSPAMVDRQNRITPAATSANMMLWNFDQYEAKIPP